jgi:hypothetical protein
MTSITHKLALTATCLLLLLLILGVVFHFTANVAEAQQAQIRPVYVKNVNESVRANLVASHCSIASLNAKNAYCSFPVNIPSGSELVIETVTWTPIVQYGPIPSSVQYELTTTGAGVRNSYGGIAGPQQVNGFFQATQLMRVYADPGTTFGCQATVSDSSGAYLWGLECNVSGYFVSVS